MNLKVAQMLHQGRRYKAVLQFDEKYVADEAEKLFDYLKSSRRDYGLVNFGPFRIKVDIDL